MGVGVGVWGVGVGVGVGMGVGVGGSGCVPDTPDALSLHMKGNTPLQIL